MLQLAIARLEQWGKERLTILGGEKILFKTNLYKNKALFNVFFPFSFRSRFHNLNYHVFGMLISIYYLIIPS